MTTQVENASLGMLLFRWRAGRPMRRVAKELGCSPQTYSAWESDFSIPEPEWSPTLREKLELDADAYLSALIQSRVAKRRGRETTPGLLAYAS